MKAENGEWEVKKLGEVCEYDKQKNTKNLPYIGLEHIESNTGRFVGTLKPLKVKSSTFHFSKSHLLYGRLRPYLNKVLLPTFEGHCSTEIFPIKTNELIMREFLYYWFMSPGTVEKIDATWTGARMPRANMKEVINFSISVPLPPEQKRIVAILDKAFSAIDKAKQNTEQNLRNAKELFQSKMQSIFDNGKLKVESGEWEEKILRDVLQKTESVNPKLNPNNKFIYLDVSSVNKKSKLIEKTTVLLGKDAPSRARKLVRTGDVIFATVRPTHGRVAIITENYNNQVCSTGYYVLRAKENLTNNFIYFFLLTCGFNKQMEILQKGASYPAVTNKEVESIYILFPVIEQQKKIVQKLNALQAETKKLENIYQQKLNDLDELKKSILSKAFKGEL
ncbi:MAG: restriction endonuclease subunit S [Methylococcales symbiont of Hymedesmia sp. n. MRB-2018]|nr:MAG: restriction endonuclease subunit S [Methylococcales symbiont of Hymedesmia sp. n. MRB-2018]